MDGWGKHLVLNARACDISRANDPQYIFDFAKELVKLIAMIPFGDPQVVHFADGKDKAGWTVVQLIETSNIIGHFLDNNGDLYLDVFSCKDFSEQQVVDFLNEKFFPEKVSYEIIMRDARK